VEAVRIDLRAYTASFRIPGMMGYQTTSLVPPPATIYGILAAAAGREVAPNETWIAYRFEYDALAQDLEKIIGFSEVGPRWDNKLNGVNTLPIIRQFLFNPHLILYLKPGEVSEAFLRPRYPLLLGRSQDVAYVERHNPATLEPVTEAKVAGILIPFPAPGIRSRIASFPTYFNLVAPRRALAVKPFHVLDSQGGAQHVKISNMLLREHEGSESLAVPLFDEKVLEP
jgi:CRISPR-associated protein Cas5t